MLRIRPIWAPREWHTQTTGANRCIAGPGAGKAAWLTAADEPIPDPQERPGGILQESGG